MGSTSIIGTMPNATDACVNVQPLGTGIGGPQGGGIVLCQCTVGALPFNTVGDGSTSGVAAFDSAGFVNSLGTSISNVIKSIEGPQVTRLPNGQVLLPSGAVVGNVPILQQGNAAMILIAGIVLLVVVMMMRK
jgi:hypothetical protein